MNSPTNEGSALAELLGEYDAEERPLRQKCHKKAGDKQSIESPGTTDILKGLFRDSILLHIR